MHRRSRIPAALPLLLALVLSLQAHAIPLIANGDFELGTLDGWTVFTTPNGALGDGNYPQVVFFDTDNDGTNSLSAAFRVGQVRRTPVSPPAGGGIYQSFYMSAGTLSISSEIAMLDGSGGSNFDGGLVELLIDGIVMDSFDFEYAVRDVTEYSLLASALFEEAGEHEIRFRFTRGFQQSLDTPVIYLDDVIVDGPLFFLIPEAATLVLFGAGLVALATGRRRWRRRH